MARLAPPTRTGLPTRAALALLRRLFGRRLEPQAITAHHRGSFWGGLLHEGVLLRSRSSLPPGLADLVNHRTAVVIGCPWCLDFSAMLALRTGVTADQLLAVPEYAGSALFSGLEKRAMAYADALTATPLTVSDEQVAALRAELGDSGLVELTHLITLENQRSRFNHGLGITAQGFTDAAVCAVPGTRAPAAGDDGPD
nr:carboxymuconolactone decarboxylase family protein [uncultured Actinotalea sp.]